ncbi:hypothetical protein A6A12_2224 [Vibrio anguillarum]|nr:hypothetical protein A6A12_2224 [Vibrio anguillarum]
MLKALIVGSFYSICLITVFLVPHFLLLALKSLNLRAALPIVSTSMGM